jgi:hypothetical protein
VVRVFVPVLLWRSTWSGVQADRAYRRHNTVKGRESGVFKSRGKRGQRWSGWVGPVFALEALMLALDAKREMEAAQVAELAELAGGTR